MRYLTHLFFGAVLCGTLMAQTEVWQSTDVGTVGTAGSDSYASGTDSFSLSGAGSGITGTADSFRFVYIPVSGNVEIIARVETLGSGNANARAGLMIRQSLDPASIHATVSVNPAGAVQMAYRSSSGGSTTTASGSTDTAPVWFRLVKSGSTFKAYQSPDGNTWTLVGQGTVSMSGTIYAGMAVSSANTASLSTATFYANRLMINVPQTSSDLKLWLRADMGMSSASGNISQWNDQSGNGLNATQSNSNKRPSLLVLPSNALNGLPVLNFDGDNDYLSIPDNSALDPSRISVIALTRRSGGSGDHVILEKYSVSSGAGYLFRYNTGTAPRFRINGVDQYGTIGSNAWGVLEGIFNQSLVKLYVNGTLAGSASHTNAITATSDALSIGGTSASKYLDGDIAEILLYSTDISDTLRQEIESYLYSKYRVGGVSATASPSASPAAGTYNSPQTVSLSADADAVIFYTTNGTTPTAASTRYTGPIGISVTTTFKAIAYKYGCPDSSVSTAMYGIPDTDNDQMADLWELNNGLDPNNAADATQDADGDGLTNRQEYQQGGNPQDYYSQGAVTITPTLSIESGNNQSGNLSTFTANPMVLKVLNGSTPLVNAPITFTVTGGGSNLAYANIGSPTLYSTVSLRTNSSGIAKIDSGSVSRDLYAKLPSSAGNLQVVASVPYHPSITATFTETAVNPDTDGDGMIDSWETAHGLNPNSSEDATLDPDGDSLTNLQEYQQGSDPNDYYSQGSSTILPAISIVSGNSQSISEPGFWANPLKVEVRNAATNALLVNAPVIFSVGLGGGKVAIDSNGSLLSTLVLNTNGSGQTQVSFKSATPALYRNTVTASTSGQQVTFTDYGLELAGRWALNENTGTTATDSSVGNHSATLTNGPQWAPGFDSFGSVNLDGINDYLTAGNPGDGSLDFGSDSFSMSLWVKFTEVSIAPGNYGRRIISKGHHGWNAGYFIGIGNGTGQIGAGIGSTQGGNPSQSILFWTSNSYNDGKWHHVVALFDRSNALGRIYVDGTAQNLVNDPQAGGSVNGSDAARVDYSGLQYLSGTRSDMNLTFSSHMGTYDFFKGGLDDIRLYRGVLTPAQITAQYDADSDTDGMPDRWEMEHFENLSQTASGNVDGDSLSNLQEYQQGEDPNDYYNGLSPQVDIIEGDLQIGEPSEYLAQALTIQVREPLNGPVLANAPVVFNVTEGDGLIAESSGDPAPQQTLFLQTDSEGKARVYLKLPASGSSHQVSAVAGDALPVAFILFNAATLPPSAPQNVLVQTLSDGGVLVTWSDSSQHETGFTIERSDDNGQTWTQVGSRAANTGHFVVAQGQAGSPSSLFRVQASNGHGSSSSGQQVIFGALEDSGDNDQDGVTNGEEIDSGTNPENADTDGDGAQDGEDAYPEDSRRWKDLPIQSYAVINISKDQTETNDAKDVALDDDNRVGFMYQRSAAPANSVGRTWYQGTLDPALVESPAPDTVETTNPHNSEPITVSRKFTAVAVNTSAKLFGNITYNEGDSDPEFPYHTPYIAGTYDGTNLDSPLLNIYPYGLPGLLLSEETTWHVDNDKNTYAAYAWLSNFWWNMGFILQEGEITAFIGDGAGNDHFEQGADVHKVTVPDAVTFNPERVVENGWAIGYKDIAGVGPGAVWDPVNEVLSELGSGEYATGINTSGMVIGMGTEGGFIWEAGESTLLEDLIPEDYREQIRNIGPVRISNRNPDEECFIECNAEILVGEGEGEWTEVKLLAKVKEIEGELSMELTEIRFPEHLSELSIHELNASGIFAALFAEEPEGIIDAGMLVPFEIVRETEPGSGQYKPIKQVPLFQGDPRQSGDSVTSTTLSVNITPKLEITAFSLSSTAVDQLNVDLEGKGAGTYKGTLQETGNQTNVFTDSQNTITLTVNQATSSRCDLLINGLGYQNVGFTLKKNGEGNYISFVQILEINLPNLSSSAVDHLTGEILLGQRDEHQRTQFDAVAIDAVETGVNTNEFIDSGNNFKFYILSQVNDRLTLEVSSTAEANQEFLVELYETGSNTHLFTSEVHALQINPKREDEANDPEALGSGVCFVSTSQIEGFDKLKMKVLSTGSSESEAPQQELALQPLTGSPGVMISEPFILIPHESQVSYNQYQGSSVRALRAEPDSLFNKILWEYISDDKPPLKTGVQTPTQRGMYAAWSILEMLRGHPTVESAMSSPDPIIKAEQEEILAALKNVKKQADTNLKLNGNVRINNLLLANAATDLGYILSNYDYVLLSTHGNTRGAPGDFLTNPGRIRVPFDGFRLIDIDSQNAAKFTTKSYGPNDIRNMTLARAPKLVFLSSCGSGETTPGSKVLELKEAFRSHVYLGWDNEVLMGQAALAEVKFFEVFKDEVTIRRAVIDANDIEPTKSDKDWMEKQPISEQFIAKLIPFEDKSNDETYTAKELIETPHPGPYQSP